MKLRNRFMLVGFGILVFLIATPILVLFTGGFKIDWKNHTLVKTGAFVVKSLPSKADVYVDNAEIKGKTPETIRFLLPGDYDLRVERQGYQSWTKRLHVQPQIVTWANLDRDFITLFLTNPTKQNSQNANFTSLSQNGDEIAAVENGNLSLYNVSNQTAQASGDISNLSFPFTFSGNLVWSNGSAAINLFRQQQPRLPFDIESIQRVDTDGNNFALISANNLYVIQSGEAKLLDKQVSTDLLDGENLWYVAGNLLKEYNLRTQISTTVNSNLPPATNAKIIRGEGNTFLLLNNSLYVLNDTLEKIYDGVTFANYDSSAHELLFANANEILLYNPSLKNTELVLRSISPVASPVMNFYTGFVFFINENNVKAIELDGRDHRNIYSLVDLGSQDNKLAVNQAGDLLTIFNDTGLTSYKIR